MFLHVFAHVDAYQCVLVAEKALGERLDKFCLSHARGSDKDERHGALFAHLERAVAADSLCHARHRPVLTDNAPVQPFLQAEQFALVGLGDVLNRYSRPQFYHARHIVNGYLCFALFGKQSVQVFLTAAFFRFCLGKYLKRHVGFMRFFRQIRTVLDHGVQFFSRFANLSGVRRLHVEPRRRLVYHINGFVRLKPVVNVFVRQCDRFADDIIVYRHIVEILVIVLGTEQNLNSLVRCRFFHRHRLESAFQCGVFFDVFSVFFRGGCADDLDVALGERRFEDVCGIQRAFRIACTDNRVHLVYHENGMFALCFIYDVFQSALKLTAVLSAGNHIRHVEQIHFLVAEFLRRLAVGYALSNALRNCRLSHAGLSQENRVVLGAPVEYLHDALDLSFPADYTVEQTLPRLFCQVVAVSFKGAFRRLASGRQSVKQRIQYSAAA